MTQVKCYVRTADKTKKAEIGISPEVTVSDIVETCIQKWSLPSDVSYNLVAINKNMVLNPNQNLIDIGIEEGEILELQPILEAGIFYESDHKKKRK
ncbi:MAG: hypothetical protein KatS3mg129_0906 [Leptospiraceae bacterium]|nr:MAG: hypothetical protein KatS3mg129_0906 [Leptospiraceae bacterium]